MSNLHKRGKLELENKIASLNKRIDELSNNKTIELEERISQIAALQHKLACTITRLALLKGQTIQEVSTLNYKP
jgi:uncharacterized coiled-coil protein SlyX